MHLCTLMCVCAPLKVTSVIRYLSSNESLRKQQSKDGKHHEQTNIVKKGTRHKINSTSNYKHSYACLWSNLCHDSSNPCRLSFIFRMACQTCSSALVHVTPFHPEMNIGHTANAGASANVGLLRVLLSHFDPVAPDDSAPMHSDCQINLLTWPHPH